MTEVLIDGVRYIPAREVIARVGDLREALLDVFWGKGYRGSDPSEAEEGLFVAVHDGDPCGGTPFGEFMDNLIAKLAERA